MEVIGVLGLLGATALAPVSDAAPTTEEIVITGERTGRSLRNTPSSVVVATDPAALPSVPDRIEQVLEFVPNVQLSSGGEGVTIRGQDTTGPTRDLAAFLGGTRPRTTVVVDGRPIGFNEFIFGITPLWDVARIELFRSPQATTQGQNSIAGAIFVVTNSASFEPDYRVRGIIGEAGTRQMSATAGGTLLPGALAYRVSGDYRFSRPSSKIADNAVGADPDHDEYGVLRIKVLAQPVALPDARIELIYSYVRSQMPQIEGVRAPFRKRRDPFATYGTFRTNVHSLSAIVGYGLSSRLKADVTVTGGVSHVRRFAPPGLGQNEIAARDWSGEAVFHWSPSEALRVVGGLAHREAWIDQQIDLSALVGKGAFDDRQTSTGLFGEATWSFAAHATLTGGLRYQRDRQVRDGAIGTGSARSGLAYAKSFDAFLPKLSMAYDVTPEWRIGVMVQRAYNPGGTTLRLDTGRADTFGAERLWDFEAFTRGSLAGDRLTFTANTFYYDMDHAQRAQPIVILTPGGRPVTFADLFNVDKARSYGLEAGLQWKATERLTVTAGLGLLRTRIVASDPSKPAFEGKQFQRSPKFSATAGIEWQPTDRFRLGVQARRNSGYFSDELETAARRVSGWTKLDARADWTIGRTTLFGYARNILNKFYMTYLFTTNFGTAGDPREAGAGIETRF